MQERSKAIALPAGNMGLVEQFLRTEVIDLKRANHLLWVSKREAQEGSSYNFDLLCEHILKFLPNDDEIDDRDKVQQWDKLKRSIGTIHWLNIIKQGVKLSEKTLKLLRETPIEQKLDAGINLKFLSVIYGQELVTTENIEVVERRLELNADNSDDLTPDNILLFIRLIQEFEPADEKSKENEQNHPYIIKGREEESFRRFRSVRNLAKYKETGDRIDEHVVKAVNQYTHNLPKDDADHFAMGFVGIYTEPKFEKWMKISRDGLKSKKLRDDLWAHARNPNNWKYEKNPRQRSLDNSYKFLRYAYKLGPEDKEDKGVVKCILLNSKPDEGKPDERNHENISFYIQLMHMDKNKTSQKLKSNEEESRNDEQIDRDIKEDFGNRNFEKWNAVIRFAKVVEEYLYFYLQGGNISQPNPGKAVRDLFMDETEKYANNLGSVDEKIKFWEVLIKEKPAIISMSRGTGFSSIFKKDPTDTVNRIRTVILPVLYKEREQEQEQELQKGINLNELRIQQ